MSCRTTSGGSVSTSLAKAVTGLEEKEIQHLFHALKREGDGMAQPSEIELHEWRSRQYDMLSRMRRMSDKRRDSLHKRLFRSRSEPVPDGATFYAWSRIEARARQEAALQSINTAVDLEPPGSQAHLYDLGEDGRPKRVWYASYGSNLHSDRFMNYIEGGQPEGSRRTYEGCDDKTPPRSDIPIRFAGARPHFALTSRVWGGGIAFIDAQKGETAQGLGRAYDISIDQFDQVVSMENGGSAKWARRLDLDEVLATGRSVLGTGSYETLLHIGDYQGAPVLTFTAPFSTKDATTRKGYITRKPAAGTDQRPIRMPVMTNKPSAAYLRMIGGGLKETFGMDEVQQADYLRGCPGGDRWTRQQMVRILRGETPDPPTAPGPDNAAKGNQKKRGSGSKKDDHPKGNGRKRGKKEEVAPAVAFSHSNADDDQLAIRYPKRAVDPDPAPRRTQRTRSDSPASPEPARPYGIPNVLTYPSVEHQQDGLRRWRGMVGHARASVQFCEKRLNDYERTVAHRGSSDGATVSRSRAVERAEADLERAREALALTQARYEEAKAQQPARYYGVNRSRSAWIAEDERVLAAQRVAETEHGKAVRALAEATEAGDRNAVARARRAVTRQQATLDEHNRRLDEIRQTMTAIDAPKTA